MILAVDAYDLGYGVGLIVGPPLLAFLGMWLWGAIRHDGPGRTRAGFRHAWSLRTLAVAGFLFLIGAIGRMGGA